MTDISIPSPVCVVENEFIILFPRKPSESEIREKDFRQQSGEKMEIRFLIIIIKL